VRSEAPGFQVAVRTRLTVEVAQTVRADLALTLSEARESITVGSTAGIIETESGQRGQAVTAREMTNIPLDGRNYLSLALLTPGAVPAAAGQNPHNINGARPDHVAYVLDGSGNMRRRGHEQTVLPSLEAVQEFRILTNAFAAEHGRMASIISVALKSGDNELHGSVFEYLRNDVLDARGFFDAETPKLKRNQFGAMLSGPVQQSKTFFMGSYEGLRSRAEETRLSRVPGVERSGDVGTPVRDPVTGAPFPGTAVPEDRIDPVARHLLQFVPLPNRSGSFNFATRASNAADMDVAAGKVDHSLGERHFLALRGIVDRRRNSSPFRGTNLPGFGSTSRTNNQHWAGTWHRVTASKTNEARVAFNRSIFREVSVNAGKNTAGEAGIAGVAAGSGLTNIVIAGYTTFGDVPALPADWTDNNYSISDTLSLNRGRHLFRIGGEYQRSQYFELFGAFTMGQLAFANAGSGHPFADFLQGYPQQAQRQVGTNKSYLFSSLAGAFFQDDWRVHPAVSLNLGLRYDLTVPPVEKFDRWANFLPELGRSITAGEAGYPRSLVRTRYRNFAPRAGLAWRISKGGPMVIRSGYGLFYDFDSQFQTYQALGATAVPFTRLELLQTSVRTRLRLADPFASITGVNPAALSPNGVAYDNPTPYTQNWNLSLGKEIRGGIGVEAAYVGAKATRQSAALNINQSIRTPQGNVTPFSGLSRVIQFMPAVNSNYHALQITARRRVGTGLAFGTGFTWSKAIDYLSFGSAARQPQNARDLAAERGLADFHRGRTWTSDVIYDIPLGRKGRLGTGWSRPVDLIFGGWQTAAIIRLYDGRPFTPSQTGNVQAGEPTRPDRLSVGAIDDPTIDRWFNVAAFRRVALNEFRFGNSGRNILIGPGKMVADVSVGKEIRTSERSRLVFRAEFFNLPNRANLGDPATAIDQPTAGIISSADSGRQIQFGLKMQF
jgi:hypothetical protein